MKTKQTIVQQILVFGLVGGVNTAVDLVVLNILMFATGITSGLMYSVFKTLSFVVAVSNSYFMNKYWTFHDHDARSSKEFSQFLIVSIGGLVINVGVSSFVVNSVSNVLGVSPQLWGTIGALAGTCVGLAWNFFGYKLFVFKR